jgi:hypothetical protein
MMDKLFSSNKCKAVYMGLIALWVLPLALVLFMVLAPLAALYHFGVTLREMVIDIKAQWKGLRQI